MNIVIFTIVVIFWLLSFYFSILTMAGIWHRLKKRPARTLDHYPGVSVLIPAHNEGIVLRHTLDAMAKLSYPGDLHIYVLNDSSTDDTGDIAAAFDQQFKHIHHVQVPSGNPRGKSRVLNYGLSLIQTKYFLIFDADNEPRPNAVQLLVEAAETTPHAVGAAGYVKTKNAHKNLLTRMISLEFQVYQLLMQSGRWQLFRAGSLMGTNMLLSREVVASLGNYDVYALAEDAELTIRIAAKGGRIPVVPEAETLEQEPETFHAYVKQRTRWMQGNFYLLEKLFFHRSYWTKGTLVHTLQHILIYCLFLQLLLVSHIWLILSLLGTIQVHYTVPLLLLWYMSYMVYTVQQLSAMTLDKTMSLINVLVATFLYFTYTQLFVFLLFRSLFSYAKSRFAGQTIDWVKTERF